jgi:hypothetical protein
MNELLKLLAQNRRQHHELPAGIETGPPANVLAVALAGRPLARGMGPALGAILNSNREILQEVRSTLGEARFGKLLAEIWEDDGLELGSVVALGVRLGFHYYRAERGGRGRCRRVWSELTELYREKRSVEALDGTVEEVLGALELEAVEFWKIESEDPETRFAATIGLLNALKDDHASMDVQDDPAIGIPGLADVVVATMQSLVAQTDREGCDNLRRLTSACTATAAGAGANHLFVADCLNRIFLLGVRRAKAQESLQLGERALSIREDKLGSKHPLVRQSRVNLGGAQVLLGHLEGADDLLETSRGGDPEDEHSQYWLARFFQARGSNGDPRSEAEAWRNFLNLGSSAVGRRWEATQRIRAIES